MQTENFPFVTEFMTDRQGQIHKVVLSLKDYRRLVETLEDEGLYQAMQSVRAEKPLNLEDALQEFEP